MLTAEEAVEQAKEMKKFQDNEREHLDVIRRYWKGRQRPPFVIPESAPSEVRKMAQIARVNICDIVINSMAQSTFVDGFRTKGDEEDSEVWRAWQRNKLDARQTGIHRACFAYRTSYSVVLPGDPLPVIRGVSPRSMTTLYGEDPDWPMWGLEWMGNGAWQLYDDEAIYFLAERDGSRKSRAGDFVYLDAKEHKARIDGHRVTPIVRYLDEHDLDAEDDVEVDDIRSGSSNSIPILHGQIAPIFSLQDQIDLTTFGLLIAQHYSAFRQRWAIGWVAPSEKEMLERMHDPGEEEETDPEELAKLLIAARRAVEMQTGASQFWTFDENPEDMKLGEFEQTSLDGYIKSREASIRHAATLSQTPVHELIGEMINLSAEALAAAEAGKDRKVNERQTSLGESHEQMLTLAGSYMGVDIPEDAEVVWRETSARSFAATVDGLGKLVTMLRIPPQELWERVPGATRQDVQRWKAAAAEGNDLLFLEDLLKRQSADPNPSEPALAA